SPAHPGGNIPPSSSASAGRRSPVRWRPSSASPPLTGRALILPASRGAHKSRRAIHSSSPRRYNGTIRSPHGRRTMTRDLILGTAGHIDHGKTTLVKALTGIDCDRLPEEKKRGITIDIGF